MKGLYCQVKGSNLGKLRTDNTRETDLATKRCREKNRSTKGGGTRTTEAVGNRN